MTIKKCHRMSGHHYLRTPKIKLLFSWYKFVLGHTHKTLDSDYARLSIKRKTQYTTSSLFYFRVDMFSRGPKFIENSNFFFFLAAKPVGQVYACLRG